MTTERPPDMLGVRASLPAPGWTVLDAARDQRFTGELVATTDTDAEYRVYFDRGDIYVAERSTDPSLGVRLVEAGAVNSAQLEYGTLRIGEIEHLGRLFDRVPSINRDAVFVLNQLMTEQTVRSLAGRSVVDVDATPYRHHPSGMHRWSTSDPSGAQPPWGDPPKLELPAPPPDARPIAGHDPAETAHPTANPTATNAEQPVESSADPGHDVGSEAGRSEADPHAADRSEADPHAADDLDHDDVVEWNEPSQLVTASRSAAAERRALFPSTTSLRTTDWVDDLGPDGLADAPIGPPVHAKLPPVAVPAAEQFEVIWPSGETVDVTTPDVTTPNGTVDHNGTVDRTVDRTVADRADTDHTSTDGSTDHSSGATGNDTGAGDTVNSRDAEGAATARDAEPGVRTPEPGETTDVSRAHDHHRADHAHDGDQPGHDRAADPISDQALAMRRAVATIDTGSLAVRRRLASPADELPPPPGRLIVGRDHHTAWRSSSERPTGSVFDAQPAEPDDPSVDDTPPVDHQERRAGALKRLIGQLRRG